MHVGSQSTPAAPLRVRLSLDPPIRASAGRWLMLEGVDRVVGVVVGPVGTVDGWWDQLSGHSAVVGEPERRL